MASVDEELVVLVALRVLVVLELLVTLVEFFAGVGAGAGAGAVEAVGNLCAWWINSFFLSKLWC